MLAREHIHKHSSQVKMNGFIQHNPGFACDANWNTISEPRYLITICIYVLIVAIHFMYGFLSMTILHHVKKLFSQFVT